MLKKIAIALILIANPYFMGEVKKTKQYPCLHKLLEDIHKLPGFNPVILLSFLYIFTGNITLSIFIIILLFALQF